MPNNTTWGNYWGDFFKARGIYTPVSKPCRVEFATSHGRDNITCMSREAADKVAERLRREGLTVRIKEVNT